MNVIYIGTSALGVPALKKIIECGHKVLEVVTQPDKSGGRGLKVTFSPMKQAATECGIPVYQPEKISEPEAITNLKSLCADIVIVAAYRQKIPNEILEMAPFGCINIHPSLLPKYRGATPVMGAILNGDELSGVTIMKMAEKMDAGDILMQEEIPLDSKETTVTLTEKSARLAALMLPKVLGAMTNGTIKPVPQDESKSSYLKQIKKEAGLINFSEAAGLIERKIRAYTPWPGTYTYLEGKVFKIFEADVISCCTPAQSQLLSEPLEDLKPSRSLPTPSLTKGPRSCVADDRADDETSAAVDRAGSDALNKSADSGNIADSALGEVVYASKGRMIIKCGEGLLEPKSVQIEGKRRMSMEEFMRGRKIVLGTVLGKPVMTDY